MEKNSLDPRTVAIHAGEHPDEETGASAPNIVMSTTFVQNAPLGFSAHDGDQDTSRIYTRWGNPTIDRLQEKLCALEQAEACHAFASGMAAISAVVIGSLSAGDHLVVSDTNYAGTAELVRNTLPRLGIEVSPVDSADTRNIEQAMRPKTRLVLIETPANPILKLTDIREAAKIAHANNARLAVDSTFASPVASKPLALGADYVIHSLTKYIGGHGDALGGAVLGNRDALADLWLEAVVHYGGVISPFNAWLIMRGAATLPLRMKAHEEGALKIARYLEDHPKVKRVLYPGLPSHPQHSLAKSQMDNFSGMLAFQTDDGENLARRFAKELRIIHYAVSLGHHRSLIYWIGTDDLMKATFKLTGRQLDGYRAWAGDGVFRLSVGLESPDDLIADLQRVLG